MPQDWALYHILENGQTAVLEKNGMIDVQTYEGCRQFIEEVFTPGISSYTLDGKLYGTAELFGGVIKSVGCRAVPRSEYRPGKHDNFHLALGFHMPEISEAFIQSRVERKFLVDEANLGSALDVMLHLNDIIWREVTAIGDSAHWLYKLRQIFPSCHPFVWTPDIATMALEAALSSKENVGVAAELLPLNPSLWLYFEPIFFFRDAAKCKIPMTFDGHIPWPDEICLDAGSFIVARVFYLDGDKLFNMDFTFEYEHDGWILCGDTFAYGIGEIPTTPGDQLLLRHLLFLQSPYLMWRPERAARSFIRRSGGHLPEAEKRIHVILLRNVVSKRVETFIAHKPVEWSCQWWVSGHWRRQWYPKTQAHKPVWVAPYIKGPLDKPLKEPIRLIVR